MRWVVSDESLLITLRWAETQPIKAKLIVQETMKKLIDHLVALAVCLVLAVVVRVADGQVLGNETKPSAMHPYLYTRSTPRPFFLKSI